jgi:hypothetical protein
MSLHELLPQLKELSHDEKCLLLHFLVSELLKESGLTPLDSKDRVANQGLHDSFEVAAILAQALNAQIAS